MTNKDFLSQFSGENNKPASFKEEERIKVTKEKKPVNVKLIVIILLIVLAIAGIVLFFLLRPTIEVKEFVGSNISDVKAWIKQNDIETKGVIFKEEYNFDYDEGYITYQSIESGKKIRKNAKMDFVVSLGADPDEIISVPDIASMYKEELQQWAKDNKLTKTKIMTAYSEEKEIGEVISYEIKGADEDSFTRSTTLNITVSKGPQPVGTVVVGDFVGKHYSEAESWGKSNKITINKTNSYSDKVEKDLIISQSIDAKKEIKEGETLTIVVSKGKAIYAANFIGMNETEVAKWEAKNTSVYREYSYSNSNKGIVVGQSVAEGAIVTGDITITVSLGKPDLSGAITLSGLKQLISDYNQDGAGLGIGNVTEENSDDVPVGNLITTYGEVNVGTKINPVVSKGKNIWLVDKPGEGENPGLSWSEVITDIGRYDEDQIRELCEYNKVNYEVKYESSYTVNPHYVISVTRANNNPVKKDTYISESEIITVVISNELLPVTE